MDFLVLGPLEARDGDRLVAIGEGKERALLALLLVHAGKSISTERVVEALWGDRPPQGASNSVHVYVSRLRKGLGSERIERSPAGYRLVLEPDELDAWRFERLVEQAREDSAEDSADRLRTALELWRGPAYADVVYEDFAAEEARRLEELQLAALESRFEADLSLGRHAEIVPELEQLVARHPLRERARGQLMLALYRSGRQADSLGRYRDGRRLLDEQLGLEPAETLRLLEQQILRHDPALDLEGAEPTTAVPQQRQLPRRAIVLAAVALAAAAAGAVLLSRALTGGTSAPPPLVANSVVRIDPSSGLRRDAALVGSTPRSVAAEGREVWVANFDDRTVSRVSEGREPEQKTVGTGGAPTAIATGGGAVWVLSSFDGRLLRLDPQTVKVVGVAVVGRGTTALAATRSAVWVTNQGRGTLSRVDPRSMRATVVRSNLAGPSGIAVDGGHVWLAESFKKRLLELDSSTGETTGRVPVRLAPDLVAVGGGAVWTTNPADGALTRVDLRTRASRFVPAGDGPIGLAVGGGHAWVVSDFDHTVSEYDAATGRVIRTIVFTPTPPPPGARFLTPGGVTVDSSGDAWVTVQRF